MRVGGPADLFVTPHNRFELRKLVQFARSRDLPHFLLGRGSDLVIADAGIRGLVIQVRAEGIRIDGERLVAEAGVQMARAATEAQKAGLTGLEFGLAIPGTVGGAVWANAGAHDGDIAGVIESASVLAADGTEGSLDVADLGFALPRQPLQARRRRRAAGARDGRDVPPDAGRSRRDRREPRRDPALAAHPPAAGDPVGRERLPQPARRLGGAPDRGRRAQGHADRRRRACPRSTRTSSSTTSAAPRPTSAVSPSTSGPSSPSAPGSTSSPRSSSSATGATGRPALVTRPAGVPVVVLLGGPSAEHDVSVVSGTAVADALAGLGHPVRQVLIDLDGGWWWLPPDHVRGDRPAAAYDDPAALGADGPLSAGAAIDRLAATDPPPVVFIALHGPFGEDGTVQAMLGAAGLTYTGAGVAASALGHGQARSSSGCAAAWACRSWTGARSAPHAGGTTRPRSPPSSRRSPPAPRTRA